MPCGRCVNEYWRNVRESAELAELADSRTVTRRYATVVRAHGMMSKRANGISSPEFSS